MTGSLSSRSSSWMTESLSSRSRWWTGSLGRKKKLGNWESYQQEHMLGAQGVLVTGVSALGRRVLAAGVSALEAIAASGGHPHRVLAAEVSVWIIGSLGCSSSSRGTGSLSSSSRSQRTGIISSRGRSICRGSE
jgi:hypothetical protein